MDTRKAVKTYHRNLAIILAIIVAIFAAIPLVVDKPYIINIFVLTFYMSTLSMAWNILGGITGQNSLGLAAYMGLGAYVCCLVVTKTGMNPWVAAVLDMLVVGVVAGVIFFPSLILRGPYFTLVSIAFAESIRQFIINSEFFGRASGVGLPFGKDSFAQFRFTSKVPYYYIGFIMMVGVYLIMKKIARTFQIMKPLKNLSVLDNVTAAAYFGHAGAKSEKEAKERAMEVLHFTGLYEKRHVISKDMGTPDQKRLEMARALATKPEVLFLDENMAGLNPAETEEAIQLIRKINESGVTILLIEHIMKAVVSLCEKVIVLHHGEKIAEGTPEQVMNDPYVMEVYLGTKKEGASA